MKFSDFQNNDLILYTYDFQYYTDTCIGIVLDYQLKDIYSLRSDNYTTDLQTMDDDDRAHVVAEIPTLDDAKIQYPELFI